MIVEFWLDNERLEQIATETMDVKIAITLILEHVTSKHNHHWFNIEFFINGDYVLVNPLLENWLDILAEIERLF